MARLILTPRIRLLTGIALLASAVFGISCSDPVEPAEPSVRSVSIAPKPPTIDIGVAVPLSATVQVTGDAPQTVVWSSTNESIATVSATGVVTSHQLGNVSITATSTFDSEKKDVAAIEVIQPDNLPATVAIQALMRSGTSIPVDPQTTSGEVDVNLIVSPGDRFVSRIELLIGTTVVATKTYSPSQQSSAAGPFGDVLPAGAPFSAVLSFNSEALNAQHAPLFVNGAYTLTVRLTTLGGVAGGTASQQLTLGNSNQLAAIVSTTGPVATDGAGREWTSGTLTVTAVPVYYSPSSATLVSATISFPGLQNKTSGSNGTVTWPRTTAIGAGGSQDFSNNGGVAALEPTIVANVMSSGPPLNGFVNASDEAIRLDNRAPQAGLLALPTQSATVNCCSGGWIGSAFLFSAAHVPTAGDGEGVDGSGISTAGISYHAGASTLTDAELAALPSIAGGAQLNESAFANAYSVVARVADRVGNVSLTRLSPSAANPSTVFGVDKASPAIAFNEQVSVVENAVNPVTLFFATVPLDSRSGFSATPVMHRITGNFSSSLCFLGGPGCAMIPGGAVITSATLDGFYYTYEALARDQAGNVSPTISRTVIVDHQPPSVTAMPVPALAPHNVLTQFSASVVDNLDLASAQHRLDFPGFAGSASIPFKPPIEISSFGAPMVQSQNLFQGLNFIRSLELTNVSHAPSGTLLATAGTRFRVLDNAGNTAMLSALFPAGSVPAGSSATDLNVQTFRITAPTAPTGVCSSQPCGLVSTSITIVAEVSGPEGTFNNPFGQNGVFFYWVDSNGVTQLFANSTAPTVGESNGVRRWTWSVQLTVPGVPAQQNVQVFAIGVDGQGDALRTQVTTNVIIIAGS